MARPRRCRRVCAEPVYGSFCPAGNAANGEVMLTLDEYEAIRLIDLEKLTHAQCAVQMDISRTTVTEIYELARTKLADVIVNGKSLFIAGGDYRLCDGSALTSGCCHQRCRKFYAGSESLLCQEKGEKAMRIAVTYDNGQIFQHFGHSSQFKVYDVEDGRIVFNADSDAIITKGIISLLIGLYSGRTPQEILSSDFSVVEKIGLKENLSPTRANGLVSMIAKIREVAAMNCQ